MRFSYSVHPFRWGIRSSRSLEITAWIQMWNWLWTTVAWRQKHVPAVFLRVCLAFSLFGSFIYIYRYIYIYTSPSLSLYILIYDITLFGWDDSHHPDLPTSSLRFQVLGASRRPRRHAAGRGALSALPSPGRWDGVSGWAGGWGQKGRGLKTVEDMGI